MAADTPASDAPIAVSDVKVVTDELQTLIESVRAPLDASAKALGARWFASSGAAAKQSGPNALSYAHFLKEADSARYLARDLDAIDSDLKTSAPNSAGMAVWRWTSKPEFGIRSLAHGCVWFVLFMQV